MTDLKIKQAMLDIAAANAGISFVIVSGKHQISFHGDIARLDETSFCLTPVNGMTTIIVSVHDLIDFHFETAGDFYIVIHINPSAVI